MSLWKVTVLGAPSARRNEIMIPSQAREAWGVLASLLVPEPIPVGRFPDSLPPQRRETLALRFWGDKDDPRVNLRQALAFLRKTFDKSALLVTSETIQAAPGAFSTDLGEMLELHARARQTIDPDEKLELLQDASARIGGRFLEKLDDAATPAGLWAQSRRVEADDRCAQVLIDLVRTLETLGQHDAAIETLHRLLTLQPEHEAGRALLWILVSKTGTIYVAPIADETLTDALDRLGDRGESALTIPARRQFQTLLDTELAALPDTLRRPLLRLCVLPGPFSDEQARAICRVKPSDLSALTETPLLARDGDRFVVPTAVRERAEKKLPTATKRLLLQKAGKFCERIVAEFYEQNLSLAPPNTPPAIRESAPLFARALTWLLQQTPPVSHTRVYCVFALASTRLFEAETDAVHEFLARVAESDRNSAMARCLAANLSGRLRYTHHDFARARVCYQRAVELSTNVPEPKARLHSLYWLGLAHHHGGDTDEGVRIVRAALGGYLDVGDAAGADMCRVILCEMRTRDEDLESALETAEATVSLRRATRPGSGHLADALFRRGQILLRMNRHADAMRSLNEALELWTKHGDHTGMGFCLRLMGRIRAAEGSFAEAESHLKNAVALNTKHSCEMSRVAAVEALADILFQQGKRDTARTHYEDCLRSCLARERSAHAETLRERIRACEIDDISSPHREKVDA